MTQPIQRLKGIKLEDVPEGASLLALAVHRLSRSLKTAVTRVVSLDQSVGLVTWRVLIGLSITSDATQRELVEFSKTEQAQLSRVMREMETRGLIQSKANPKDKREKLFSLTEVGYQKYHALLPQVKHLTDAMDVALSPDEQIQFLSMCERISMAAKQAGEYRPNHMGQRSGPLSTEDLEKIV
ncbi:MAG: DNA-binding MarR family transcriptional regulator [Granulosicoccus sp.]